MGMFDYVKIESELPEKYQSVEDWQTKCLDCRLDKYLINSDGELILEEVLDPTEDGYVSPMGRDFTVRSNYSGDLNLIGEIAGDWVRIEYRFENGSILYRYGIEDEN